MTHREHELVGLPVGVEISRHGDKNRDIENSRIAVVPGNRVPDRDNNDQEPEYEYPGPANIA